MEPSGACFLQGNGSLESVFDDLGVRKLDLGGGFEFLSLFCLARALLWLSEQSFLGAPSSCGFGLGALGPWGLGPWA